MKSNIRVSIYLSSGDNSNIEARLQIHDKMLWKKYFKNIPKRGESEKGLSVYK